MKPNVLGANLYRLRLIDSWFVPDSQVESKQLDRAVMIRLWGQDHDDDQIAPEHGGA